MFDGKAFGAEMTDIVKGFVDRATAPLLERIAVLEAREVPQPIDGKDGRDGIDGKDGADGAPGRDGRDGLNGVQGEKGMDGRDGLNGSDGRDGVDGLGFDDLEVVHDGERGFVVRFIQGERAKEFPFTVPLVLDRGVYKAGENYTKGDAVTWAGSLWIAQKETDAKPDGGDWRLAVKRGRDGKDKA